MSTQSSSVVPKGVPLWQQLRYSAEMLAAVAAGRSLTEAFRKVPAELMPGVQALTYQALRSLGRARFLRDQLVTRQPPPPVDALLCLSLALAGRDGMTPYPAHTLVDQTVETAKRWKAARGSASFVNACLRRYLREQVTLLAQSESAVVARWNHPQWWIDRLKHQYPDRWESILLSGQKPAALTLRPNLRRVTRTELLNRFRVEGVDARPVGQVGIQLSETARLGRLRGLENGEYSVQDSAAQLAAPLLMAPLEGCPQPHILDACAAPGGKTAHLAELRSDARIQALEIDADRAVRIRENLTRLGLQATLSVADASLPETWWSGEPFDGILLDAPCTASGIVRRHPDIPWLRREADLNQLAAIQKKLLDVLWPLLRPGGVMVYCTCSVFHEEGQIQIAAFLRRNSQAALMESPGHLLPHASLLPGESPENSLGEHDGFYYAVLRKMAA